MNFHPDKLGKGGIRGGSDFIHRVNKIREILDDDLKRGYYLVG